MSHTSARPRPLRGTFAVIILTALLMSLLPAPEAVAAPVVAGGGDFDLPYTEQESPIAIGGGLTVTDGGTYDGRYVDFAVGSPQGTEFLTLAGDESASTDAGTVSVVGTSVFLGDGTTAEPIGSVDSILDGSDGQTLRVNFTSPFTNPSFESGNTDGWTVLNQRIDLGVTEIAGFTSIDTATYPGASEDNNAPTSETYTVSVSTEASATDGSRALRLWSGISTSQGYDVVHGPAAVSDQFEAADGDVIYFDWRAFAGSDAYHIFGYIIDEAGNQTEVLDTYTNDTTGSTAWTTKATTIPSDGTYRFVFVAGTYDASGGQAAGASLYIDNVRVFGSKVSDAVVQQVARKLQYFNDSDNPAASQTVTVTAMASDGSSGSESISLDITPVDDAPTMGAIPGATYLNEQDTEAFVDHVTTLPGSDPEHDTLAYTLTGATPDATTIDGVEYSHSAAGDYGIVHVHSATGAVRYVPDQAALAERSLDASEVFTFTVTANELSDSGTLTITIDVPPTASSAPTGLEARAGNRQVDLTWSAPAWLGNSPVTGYQIEQSENGTDWTIVVADTESTDTSHTISELDNGVALEFRVSAINGNGTSGPSGVVSATPRAPASAPACDYNASSFSSDVGGWEVPCWTGPTAADPATDADGWMAEPSAFAIANGLVTPTPDGRIAPATSVSRADIATMLRRLAGDPAAAGAHSFSDAGAAEAEALAWLESIGVVEGVGEGRYAGERTVTRAEAVVLLWRLAGRPVPASGHGFADVSDDWMVDAISWAVASGVVHGRSSAVFDPNAGVTRGELFAVLYRWTSGVEASAG